jgi:predicted phage tail protein
MNIERVAIENPFTLARDVRLIEIEGPKTLADYVREYAREKCAALSLSDAELDELERNLVTVYNGAVIAVEDRPFLLPRDGSQVIIAPYIQGGQGAGKNILRAVAMIGIAILAYYFPPAVGLKGAWAAVASAGIAIGGSMLINAILPMPGIDTGAEESPTYGWSGPVMTSRQGIPLQRGYGKFTVGGNVINSYVRTVIDKQYLNVLIAYGHGLLRSIDNIRINDNPIGNYQGVAIEKRMGYLDQAPVSYFGDIHADYPQNAKIIGGASPVVVEGHRDDATALEVELYYPKGVWRLSDDNKYKDYTVKGKVEYKLHADSTWQPALVPRTTVDVVDHHWVAIALDRTISGYKTTLVYGYDDGPGDHYYGEPYKEYVTEPVYDETETPSNMVVEKNGVWVLATDVQGPTQMATNWSSKSFEFTGHEVKPRRQVISISGLAAGKYDVRVAKTSTEENSTKFGDECWVASIRETAPDDLEHPGIGLMGLRAMATDRLSGGGLNVVADVTWAEPETTGYKHCVAADRPRLLYRFNETSGTECFDSSGMNRHGTYHDVTLGAETLLNNSPSKAAGFKYAESSYVSVNTPETMSANWSVECWFKPENSGGWLIGSADSQTGFVFAQFRPAFIVNNVYHTVDDPLELNQRYHLALVCRNSSLEFYVNGRRVSHPAYTVVGNPFPMEHVGRAFNGTMDEVAMYNYALQGGRVRAHYERGIADNRLEDYTCDNPAIVCWDIMTNPVYGGGIPYSVMDAQAFKEWADYCNELVPDGAGGTMYRSTFGGVFDTSGNVWDAVGKVARLGRAVVVRTGLNYTVITDKPSSPVQLFTVGNMIRGSFRELWLSMSDRANSVDISFFDMELGKPRPITVQDEAAINNGDPVRSAPAIQLFGCTSEAQAWREGWYLIQANKHLRRAVQWESNVEAIACRVGQVVKVQHDLTEWGEGGKLEGGDTTTLRLDREVTIDPAKQYRVLVVFPTYKAVDGTISLVSGNRVYIEGFNPTSWPDVKRCKVGELDRKIVNTGLATLNGNPVGWVEVSDSTGFTQGAEADLYEIDSLQYRDVANPYTEVSTLSEVILESPFYDPVAQGYTYSFGQVNNEAKEFRVTSITRSQDLRYQITAAEYNPLVYQDLEPIITGPAPVPFPQMVANLRLDQGVAPDGQQYATVGWKNGRTTFGVKLYREDNGGGEYLFGEPIQGKESTTIPVVSGQSLKVRVVGYDGRLKDAPYDSSPSAEITVGAEAPSDPATAPGNVQNFKAYTSGANTTLSWTKNGETDLANYEIRLAADATTPWSAATLVTSPIASATSYTAVLAAGVYLIKAKNSGGQYSVGAASVTVNLSTLPMDVQGFQVYDNNLSSELSWLPNTEANLSAYEIRKATSYTTTWAAATFFATMAATATSRNVTAAAYYLIKAKNSSNEYSAGAAKVYANPIKDNRYTGGL